MKRPRYSQQDKERFWKALSKYKEALRTGDCIVGASLVVHAALNTVPKSYRRYVTRAFSTGGKE